MRKLSKTLLSLLLIAAMLASFVVLPAGLRNRPQSSRPRLCRRLRRRRRILLS